MKKLELIKVRWKNLLSYGETWSEVEFTRNKMTLITGQNGNGKSSFIEATCYALFGKTIRKVPKSNIVNTKNQKGLMVELLFVSNDDKTYLVRRGIKPNKFEIYEGKNLIAQDASVKEYQERLDAIIGIDYETFIQTVIISKTKYVPFMKLDAASRRGFVENLLTLTIFGNMNKKQKIVLSNLKEQLQTIKNDYSIAKTNVSQSENNVRSINELLQQNLTEKQTYINTKIDEMKAINEDIKSSAKALKDSLFVDENNTVEAHEHAETMIRKANNELSSVERELSVLEKSSDTCSSCGQTLTTEQLEQTREKIKDKVSRIMTLKHSISCNETLLIELQPTLDLLRENDETQREIKNMVMSIKNNNKQIEQFERERDGLVFDDSKLVEAKNSLKEYRQEFDKLGVDLNECKEQYEYNVIVNDMLKDGGIKASIIDKSIPLINSVINKNLSKFGFFVQFQLDSEFNETIKQRGIDVLTYDSFSEGEKLRIDMAVLLAWREVAQLQNNLSCNVLLFDEMTDASMDHDGSEILGSLLSELDNTHVFVITHSPEKLQTYADGSMHIKKENGYSKIN